MENKNTNDWEVIDVYSRKNALADGVQVRCPDAIRQEAGIRFPVFFTTTLWEEYILPPAGMDNEGQSIDGRLWDVLYMFHFNVKAQQLSQNRMWYKVIFRMPKKSDKTGCSGKSVTVTLESVIGPTDFDDPRPAITIKLPGED